jgi:hypothetical protein
LRRGILLGVGLASEMLYIAAVARLPWWRYGKALRSWRDLLGADLGTLLLCLVCAVVLFALYSLGWYALCGQDQHEQETLQRIVWVFALVFSATLFWLMPITSDLFGYLGQAHLLTDLGGNPLRDALVQPDGAGLTTDPNDDLLVSAFPTVYNSSPSIYGPAWILVSAPGTLGRNDVKYGLLYLKTLATAAFLGSALLLECILKKIRPAAVLGSLYLFTWNPLLLLMAVADGHNDIVMMVVVLLAFWFLVGGSWVLAFAALAFSAWIKYVGALFAPLFIVYVWAHSKQRGDPNPWLALGKGSLAGLATSGLVLGPLGSIEWGVDVLQRLLIPANWAWTYAPDLAARSHLTSVHLGASVGAFFSYVPTVALVVGMFLFAVAYLLLTGRLVADLRGLNFCNRLSARAGAGGQSDFLRRDWVQRLLDVGFMVSLLLFLLGAARSQPWHLIWPASLAGLSTRRWAWAVVIFLSVLMLVSQFWVEWGMPGVGNMS